MDLLAQMRTFVRVVEGKSLSAAARSQHLSLAAVSRQLSALEADLDTTLVVRSTRKLHVTEAGQKWYAHCLRVLHDVDEARSSMRSKGGVHGSLVVSVSLTFGMVLVAPRMRQLATKHPHLAIDLRLEDQLVDLVAEGVDLAIRAGAPPPDSTAYLAQPLFDVRRLLVASPVWVKKHGAPTQPAQLARRDCLVQVTPAGSVVRWSLERTSESGAVERETVEVRGQIRSNAPYALRALALDALGPAYLPEWLVADDLRKGRLRRLLPDWSSVPLGAWGVYRAELRGSPRIRAFLAALAS